MKFPSTRPQPISRNAQIRNYKTSADSVELNYYTKFDRVIGSNKKLKINNITMNKTKFHSKRKTIMR